MKTSCNLTTINVVRTLSVLLSHLFIGLSLERTELELYLYNIMMLFTFVLIGPFCGHGVRTVVAAGLCDEQHTYHFLR